MIARFLVSMLLLASAAAAADPRTFNFMADKIGAAPAGFTLERTGNGRQGTWSVRADSETGRNILAQTDGTSRSDNHFPLAVTDAVSAADVDVSVKIKPISGTRDMAGGLVWRYRDKDNYYIVRANALEDNVVLYKVENGRRSDLALLGLGKTYGAKVPVPKGQWSTLRVVAEGSLFTVHFNGQKLFEVEDTTFKDAGKVGVWTKADSVTYFDDLVVIAR